MTKPLALVVRHGWALVVLVLLVLIALDSTAPNSAQVDAVVATEAHRAAAMVKQQQKVEHAEQLAELSR